MENKDIDEKRKEAEFFQYSLITVLYANDCALNMALNVCNAFRYTNYKSKIFKTLCNSIKRESEKYFSAFNDVFKENIEFISEFNVMCDERCDEMTDKVVEKIQETLDKVGVENAEFIAMLETCRFLVGYSCKMNDKVIEKAGARFKSVNVIESWNITRIKKMVEDLSDYVFSVVPKDINLDLNKVDGLSDTLNDWMKNIFSLEKYEEKINSIK